ncbi:hypothetical protein AKJ37_02105 [candidate division MSBL1 archaeon SCGC-AAA259I09]|uniref:4Fe-4S ferredoxin-type domain-containing protein n=2 Tax=candidate division MSBL1 TaxID=215777 RepID=A0A133UUI8_9EURY|nr:hypothetical protein AKJ66_01600 [candidate division MSBL1 archaeon SCGC-AAA259E22]KXA97878.1 hypothetical protein AKJ37_02105 [candidate division MSBL1 archaeon SCGC-AAA259I09]
MKTVLVNPERCVGCMQCQVACAIEHSQSKNLYEAVFESPKPRERIYASPGMYLNTSFPNKCRHCKPAPCLEICPTNAIGRDEDTDIVTIDGDKCITCAMCAMACPYDVIRYYKSSKTIDPDKEVATKCDNCIERQRRGEEPACVEVCKVDALVFGDVNKLEDTATGRLTKAMSAARGAIETGAPTTPGNYEAWQAWGEEVGKINKKEG